MRARNGMRALRSHVTLYPEVVASGSGEGAITSAVANMRTRPLPRPCTCNERCRVRSSPQNVSCQGIRMLTLHDYLPSMNGWKVRVLLGHLGVAYQSKPVAIFSGASRTRDFLDLNPVGAIPVLELEDGRALAE